MGTICVPGVAGIGVWVSCRTHGKGLVGVGHVRARTTLRQGAVSEGFALVCGGEQFDNETVSVTVCTECNKNYSYHIKPGCKNKYEKNNSNPPVCENCNAPHGERDNIYIQRSPSPLIKS